MRFNSSTVTDIINVLLVSLQADHARQYPWDRQLVCLKGFEVFRLRGFPRITYPHI